MSAAFEALGRPLPPWRNLESVVAKWQPKRFVDIRVSDGIEDRVGGGGGGAGHAAALIGEEAALGELQREMTAMGI